jgi:hypothetical protein
MIEMLLGKSIFDGDTEISNLIKIFKFTGSPDKKLLNEIQNKSDDD